MSRHLTSREVAERVGQLHERAPDGWTLGKLLIRAVDAEALGGAVSMSGLSDEGLLDCVERYLDKLDAGADAGKDGAR